MERNKVLDNILREIVEVSNLDLMQENANVDGSTPMGQMGKFGSESSKYYAKEYLLSDEAKEYVDKNLIHIHDLDFYSTGTVTCSQIPLGRLLADGFNTGHGTMRTPGDIHSAMALASIIFQSNQNMQHGGQSYPMFDFDLAPYVIKTFKKIKSRLEDYGMDKSEEEIERIAWKETDREVYQACEAFIHNSNSMHSRGGGQVPFVSINYGTDTSKAGRLVIKNILKATEAGLGNGETPIFPIQVFKMKKGINYERGEMNYDLYELALKVTSKRLFPNFSFIDAPFNLAYYNGRPESEVAYMGCLDGGEVICYKVSGELFVENFRSAYARISGMFEVREYGISEYVDVEGKGVYIKDSSNGEFTEVKKFIKNPDRNNWKRIVFEHGFDIVATTDHPFPVKDKGRVLVSDLEVGDKIPKSRALLLDERENPYNTIDFIQDIEVNDFSYDVETASDMFDVSGIVSHNCRTRVMSNIHGEENSIGRGNISFTSINLVGLALVSNGIEDFKVRLRELIGVVERQLLDRYAFQSKKLARNFPFMYREGIWRGDRLGENETVEEIIKQGTLSIGFIGLAECLKELTGRHHGEDEWAAELGLGIVGLMREECDRLIDKHNLNFSLLGTPAEGLAGKFVKGDREVYGLRVGITDRDYYTNSFHVPVYHKIKAIDKLRIEGPYHELCNAGHISYVELDGDVSKNLEVLDVLVKEMGRVGIGYGSINHPVDTCKVCGYKGIIDNECGSCGIKGEENVERIRRITGYLVGDMGKWNTAKKSEEKDREKH